MIIRLNHTIVHARDRDGAARFLSDILGLAKANRAMMQMVKFDIAAPKRAYDG